MAGSSTSDHLEIKNIFKAESKKLGFCFCGFTTPAQPVDFPLYLDWLAQETSGDMAFLARQDHIAKRRQPTLLMESCRTIVILGVSIQKHDTEQPFLLADFAHYRDYHIQLHEICQQLMNVVQEKCGRKSNYRIFVDSAPVLERSLAVQADLGWIGRNSMFIHPEFGSMVLLAEIFLDWAIAEKQAVPIQDHCGKCHRCIDICPTGCIDPVNRTIRADQCVSYLTIEHKGTLNPEFAQKCGRYIFGCDLCVHICPWNQKNFRNYTPLIQASLPEFNGKESLEELKTALYKAHRWSA